MKQKRAIQRAIELAKEEGFPVDVQEKEKYFMEQVQDGESLASDRKLFFVRSPPGRFNLTCYWHSISDDRSCSCVLQSAQGVPDSRRFDRYL